MTNQNSLSAHNPSSWLGAVWETLQVAREDSIPEGTDAYDEQWNDVCTAMSWISEALRESFDEVSSEDQLLSYISKVVSSWVREEVEANDASVPPEQRIDEHCDQLIEELSKALRERVSGIVALSHSESA